jgi:hypothetical protein
MTPVGFCTGHERTTVWGDRERYVGSHLVTGDNGVPSHHTPWCCYWTHRPLQKGVGSSPCVGGSKNVYFDGSYALVLECNPSHVRESPAFATVSPLIHPSLGSLRGASIGATCAPRLQYFTVRLDTTIRLDKWRFLLPQQLSCLDFCTIS